MSTKKLKDMDIRNIKHELNMGYISSRYFEISKNCFCNIHFNTYKNLVEIRVFNEELIKWATPSSSLKLRIAST